MSIRSRKKRHDVRYSAVGGFCADKTTHAYGGVALRDVRLLTRQSDIPSLACTTAWGSLQVNDMMQKASNNMHTCPCHTNCPEKIHAHIEAKRLSPLPPTYARRRVQQPLHVGPRGAIHKAGVRLNFNYLDWLVEDCYNLSL